MTPKESNVGFGLGIFLILGVVISFLPQYYKIIKTKSVEGISHWSLGLNNISCFCALFGSFMLDYYILNDCYKDTFCGRNIVPFLQLILIWLCMLIYYILYIVYYNRTETEIYTTEGFLFMNYKFSKIKREAYYVYGFFAFYITVFLGAVSLTSVVLIANWENWEKHGILFGDMLNILAAMITSFFWIPQIYETWKKQDIGALSLATLVMQTPGSLLTFLFQVLISHSSWFIGAPYLISFILQTILLTMGIIFEYNKQKNNTNISALYEDEDETTTLLTDVIELNPSINRMTVNPLYFEYDDTSYDSSNDL